MNRTILPWKWLCVFICTLSYVQAQETTPLFTKFTYQGNDEIYNKYPVGKNEFYTPILQGFYPDPSITRKGNDYYLVNSTFSFYPGVPIFHSTDLVNWKQIGHVLDRPSQLKLEGLEIRDGIYAPDIVYNPYNDTFYMITTLVGGMGNFVVKAKDPAGPWSDPIKIDVGGIDPALFFDEDGKAYLVHNDEPDKVTYEGHRAIRMWEYDIENDRVVGNGKIIVDGGVDITKKPIWIEGPHLYKKNGLYYIMCAEGGTSDNHREVIFRSSSPMGPYAPAEKNPILTQMGLPENREDKITCAGHADLIETPTGEWYAVFLACRPNETGRVNTGRETFILPVEWVDGFPVFKGGLEPIPLKLPTPAGVTNQTGKNDYLPNGNFIFEDNFTTDLLDKRWIAVRGPYDNFISYTGNGIRLISTGKSIKTKSTPAMICYRQQHNSFTATTIMQYQPQKEQQIAGITCFQNDKYNYIFGVIFKENKNYIILEKTENGKSDLIASEEIVNPGQPLQLQVKAGGNTLQFSYAPENGKFRNLGDTLPADILSTDVAGGFTGTVIGLYTGPADNI